MYFTREGMTTDLANNSRINSQLNGAPVYLQADYDIPSIPIERQIRQTQNTTANTNASASKVVPNGNLWLCGDNPTAATVVYALTSQDLYNLGNRRVTLSFIGTRHAANSITITLPASGRFVASGSAAFYTSMTIAPNVYGAVDIVFSELTGGFVYVNIVGDTTGFTFA